MTPVLQHLVWEIDVGFLLMSHLQCLPLYFQMKTLSLNAFWMKS